MNINESNAIQCDPTEALGIKSPQLQSSVESSWSSGLLLDYHGEGVKGWVARHTTAHMHAMCTQRETFSGLILL